MKRAIQTIFVVVAVVKSTTDETYLSFLNAVCEYETVLVISWIIVWNELFF